MPAEKQNRISEKLDGMDRLPGGFDFHAEKVWNKLQPQLKKESINYRAVFFAAASVIAIIIFLTIPFKKVKHRQGSDNQHEVAQEVKPGIKNESLNIAPLIEEKKSQVVQAKVHTVNKATATDDKIPVITVNHPAPQNIQPIEIDAPDNKSEQPVTTVTVRAKRRFPVAHINDMQPGNIVAEEPGEKRMASVYPFKKPSNISSPAASREDDGYPEQKKIRSLFLNTNSH